MTFAEAMAAVLDDDAWRMTRPRESYPIKVWLAQDPRVRGEWRTDRPLQIADLNAHDWELDRIPF